MTVRVMIGPSLKRPLSVGALRMALFNYAFAVGRRGSFGVRIEDTDQARMNAQLLDDLYAMLEWTGIDYHEGGVKGGGCGPYVQSERLGHYREHAGALLRSGAAYRCFCSTERLAGDRERQRALGERSRYDGRCGALSPDEAAERAAGGQANVVRMRVPQDGAGEILVPDEIAGDARVPLSALDDQVLLKSDGFPTYHFSSVVDDHLMGISHVVRSDSWLSSTPKHVLLYRAFGWEPPVFAHVPAISRGGWSTPVRELRDQGVPVDAVVNYAAGIGWQPSGGAELFTLADLTAEFDLKAIRRSVRTADPNRLRWLSGRHLRRQPAQDAAEALTPHLRALGLPVPPAERRREIVELCQPYSRTYRELAEQHAYFFRAPQHGPQLRAELLGLAGLLGTLSTALAQVRPFTAAALRQQVQAVTQDDAGGTAALRALRLAVCGDVRSPNIFAVLAVLGRAECGRRLAAAIGGSGAEPAAEPALSGIGVHG
ncbi:glutamate--tRNA ligase [Kitasatospora viridis]|uniref:Glutamate--tRNA ligase n=1 Tax=Kitasatospora viridis TaxID=281105 RepID=A0A561T6C6_9ACTN|nr:glutamate--tRNA ligase [Kitasatospora viridis]TWF82666.1 glutamyl-tRNA synthetase/nondiscriminating glutamyl-tRNA synthetase [Kitasatospora viridis]